MHLPSRLRNSTRSSVASSADLDVKRFLRGEMRTVRPHGGDHSADGATLEGVDDRGPGAVDVAELHIPGPQLEPGPVLQAERNFAALDGRSDLGS